MNAGSNAALLSLLFAWTAIGAELTGKVVGPDGQPIAGATVYIHSAAPIKGTAVKNPFDYPECGKQTTSDAAGQFSVSEIDPLLRFQVLVCADGFQPAMLKRVTFDAAATAKLVAIPKELDTNCTIRGHVVDSKGEPVIGAFVQPKGYVQGTMRVQGAIDEIPSGYTDAKGNFLLISKLPNVRVHLVLRDAAHAAATAVSLNALEAAQDVTMPAGATVAGRIMCRGSGVADVPLNLTPERMQNPADLEKDTGGCSTVATDNGNFLFVNVPADKSYILTAKLRAVAPLGVVPAKLCAVQGDETTLEVGDIEVEPGHTLSGALVCSDDKPLPEGTKVRLSRQRPTEQLEAKVDEKGHFEFKWLPEEPCDLTVTAKGYVLSPDNESIEPRNKAALLGLIDADIDIRVKLDPGEASNVRQVYDGNALERLSRTQMKGVDAP